VLQSEYLTQWSIRSLGNSAATGELKAGLPEYRFPEGNGFGDTVVSWNATGRGSLAVYRIGAGGGLGFFWRQQFPARRRSEYTGTNKNIREGKARGEKTSHAHGDRLVIEDKSARTARVVGQCRAELWQSINRDFHIEESAGHQMLLRICQTADTIAEYDEEVGRDGVTIRTKGSVRERPLLKHRLAAQSFIVRSLHRRR
jgi:hypothetical protein